MDDDPSVARSVQITLNSDENAASIGEATHTRKKIALSGEAEEEE